VRAAAEMIDQFYGFGEVPCIVDFAESLTDNLLGTFTLSDMTGKDIQLIHDQYKLDIVFNNEIKASYDFSEWGDTAKYALADHLTDWERLAGNLKLVCTKQERPTVDDEEPMRLA
jgi:hypothetical protein